MYLIVIVERNHLKKAAQTLMGLFIVFLFVVCCFVICFVDICFVVHTVDL